jgi:hypothetical protein
MLRTLLYMEFGKVEASALEEIDFTLTPDRNETKSLLSEAKKRESKIFVGRAKWGRKDWIGKFYPQGTKETDFLSHRIKTWVDQGIDTVYLFLHQHDEIHS